MEAARKNNYFFGTSSSCIYELVLCNRGSDHDCSPLIPFLGQVKALVFYRSMHLCNLYLDLHSSITLWYLENNKELCCSYESSLLLLLSDFRFASGSELLVTQKHR